MRPGRDYVTVNNRHYEIRFGGTSYAHGNYVSDFLTRVDTAILSRSDDLFDLIDFDSFVDWFVVMELFRDHDAGRTSKFMQIRFDADGNRFLEMGPVWDFDHTSAASNWQMPPHPYVVWIPNGHPTTRRYPNVWYASLMRIPEFREAVAARFIEVRDTFLPRTNAYIQALAYYNADCFNRNFERWPILGTYLLRTPRELIAIDTFAGQVDFLTPWLTTRADWLAGYFNNFTPYLNIEAVQFADTTVNRGDDVLLVHLYVHTANTETTTPRLLDYTVMSDGNLLARGTFNEAAQGEIILELRNIQPIRAGEITVLIRYEVSWQTHLAPEGAAVPTWTVPMQLVYGPVLLDVVG